MKHETSIRSQFGITQSEMAMLLKVTRSLLSLYEIGKRDLPLPAQQLLAEMLTHVPATAVNINSESKTQQKSNQNYFERLLRNNEFKQLRLAKAIAAIERKQAAQQGLSRLIDFLNSRQDKSVKIADVAYRGINRKAERALKENHNAILERHNHKLKLLQFEKTILQSNINR